MRVKINTREAILKVALKLFSEKGIDAISTRDIAKKVKISVGNLTYHFPAKNDIVYELCKELMTAVNDLACQGFDNRLNIFEAYFSLMKSIFGIHLRYRFIFDKRYAEIVTSIPAVHDYYRNMVVKRFSFLKTVHTEMVRQKLAIGALLKDTPQLNHTLNILAMFWQQEIKVYYPERTDAQKIEYALAVFFQPYKPYLTSRGSRIFTELVPSAPASL